MRTSAAMPQMPFLPSAARVLLSVALVATLAGCDMDAVKSADSLKAEARQSIEAKNFSEAATRARKLTEKTPDDYEAYFLLAQAKAQVGDKNAAIVALEQAIKHGLKDDEQIDKNPNLDNIRSMGAYTDLMNSSFPSRRAAQEKAAQAHAPADETEAAGASVSIREINGKQVLRAGDVVVEVPALK